jgi:hypothetical protein
MRASPRYLARLLACSGILITGALSHVAAQSDVRIADEHLLGTWRLDVSKSKYSPGPPPKSETRLYARDEAGVRGRIDRQYADGRREVIDYRADADHDSPVSGTQAYDAVRFRRLDARTTEAVLSHAGRVWGTARRVVSDSGDMLTITFRRIEPGDMVNNVAVYHKERK